MPTTLAYDTIR